MIITQQQVQYAKYRRSQIAELADWTPGFDMSGVSVSDSDKRAGSPKLGDKIARNPVNHADRWLVAADYFLVNFEPIEQGAHPGAAKSLNAMAADLLRPYLKLGQKVIWRESFRWHDDNGVLSNHYDGMELEQLSDAFGYDWHYDMNLKHAAIVWDKVAAPQPQQEQP